MHLKKNRSAEVVAINKIYKNKIYHLQYSAPQPLQCHYSTMLKPLHIIRD